MTRFYSVITVIIVSILMFNGFQCSSTELTSAKLYIQQKNMDKALESLEKEVAKNPKSDEGFYLMGYIHGEKENFDKLLDAYNSSLSISKKFEKDIDNSKKYHWANLFNKGVGFFSRATNTADTDSATLFFDKSIFAFKNAIKLEPDSASTYQNLAYVYLNAGRDFEAIEPLKKMIELAGWLISKNVINMSSSTLRNEYGDPDDIITSVYKNKDHRTYVYRKLNAWIYLQDDKVVGFTSINKGVGPVDAFKLLGQVYYSLGQKSWVAYEENKDTKDSLQALNYYNQAIKVLEDGRSFYPSNSDILLFLSNAYISANKIDVAIGAFKAGVEQEPENKYYRYNYGVLLLGANEFEKAAEQFTKAIEIDPEYQNAIYNLAVTYVKWGAKLAKDAEAEGKESEEAKVKYQKALPHLETYVGKKSDDAAVWELLGRVYSILGMLDDAQNAFNKADALRK